MGKQNSSVLKLVTLLPFLVIAFVTGSEIFNLKQVYLFISNRFIYLFKRLAISDRYRRRRLRRRLPTYPSRKFLLVLFSFHFPTK